MAYGTLGLDVLQSSTAGTPPQFNDGNGTQIGKLARAWVNYNQATSTINNSFNVSSITNNGTGDFTINFTNAMPSANYMWSGSAGFGVGGQTNWLSLPGNIAVASCMTTTSLRVVNSYQNNTANSNIPYNGVIVFA